MARMTVELKKRLWEYIEGTELYENGPGDSERDREIHTELRDLEALGAGRRGEVSNTALGWLLDRAELLAEDPDQYDRQAARAFIDAYAGRYEEPKPKAPAPTLRFCGLPGGRKTYRVTGSWAAWRGAFPELPADPRAVWENPKILAALAGHEITLTTAAGEERRKTLITLDLPGQSRYGWDAYGSFVGGAGDAGPGMCGEDNAYPKLYPTCGKRVQWRSMEAEEFPAHGAAMVIPVCPTCIAGFIIHKRVKGTV